MQRTPLNADNPKLRTPWYAHVTPWMLIVLIALGGTFAVDLGHQHGPLIAAGLVGLAVVFQLYKTLMLFTSPMSKVTMGTP